MTITLMTIFLFAESGGLAVSPESVITVIISTIGTWGITGAIKSKFPTGSFANTIISIGLSFLIAVIALVATDVIGGNEVSLERVSYYGLQAFVYANVVYRGIQAVSSGDK